ncbi:MAG: hypothetical protein Q9193_002260 [Seirophora villosa]
MMPCLDAGFDPRNDYRDDHEFAASNGDHSLDSRTNHLVNCFRVSYIRVSYIRVNVPTKSTWTPTPITSVMTVTGQVKTITITPTAPPTAAAIAQSPDGGFMSHPGKVAGLFVGVGLIICLLAAALVWFCYRRKRDVEAETIASTVGEETPQRRQSKLSTMGLLGGTRRSNNRKSVPPIQTSSWGPGNSAEKSPTDTPIDYRRTSYPRIVDQRLEPTALWNPLQDNGSHVSIQSFRDDQDYSRRMLRVANPDDRPVSRD